MLASIGSISDGQSIIGTSMLMQLAVARGCDAQQLLAEAGIPEQLLKDPHSRVSAQQDIALAGALVDLLDDPMLGFEAGSNYRLSAFGSLGLAAASSNSAYDAIKLFLRFLKLSYTYFDVTLVKTSTNAVLRFKDQYDLGKLKKYFVERDIAFAIMAMKDVLPNFKMTEMISEIRFDYSAPLFADKYSGILGCPVKFNCEFNEIVSPISYLDTPLPLANELSRQLLEEQCQQQIEQVRSSKSFTRDIRDVIHRSEGQLPNLEDIASTMNITSRTVRRKLKAENTSFQTLVVDVLSKKAITYLETSHLTVEQISQRLGYSESASFIHAFKRWTGRSPRVYRGK